MVDIIKIKVNNHGIMGTQLIFIFSHRMALVTEECGEVGDSCASASNVNRCNIPRQTF